MNTEKNAIRQFSVSFATQENFAVIYEFLPEHESFLPALVDGIKYMSTQEVTIFCTKSEMFSAVEDPQKVVIKEEKVVLVHSTILS